MASWKKDLKRYVSRAINHGIMYSTSSNFKLIGYTESGFVSSIDERKSTTCYIFNLGSSAILWESKKKPIVTISLGEAEYVGVTSVAFQEMWM